MMFAFSKEWYTVAGERIEKNGRMAACVWLHDIGEEYERFGLTKEIIEQCRSNQLFYRKGVQNTERYSFCILPIINRDSQKEERNRFGIYFDKKRFILILIEDAEKKTENFFLSAMEKCKSKNSLSKILYSFLDILLESDAIVLENMDFRIARIEEKLVKERMTRKFHYDILEMKHELLLIRSYYEQLLEIGERFYENENGMVEEDDRESFLIFKERVKRFRENVTFLKDNLVEVREAYDSYMDLSMNSIMKFFTVVTTVFMPLTLMTGWYGMNFEHMPEISYQYAYPVFGVVSIVVLISCLCIFKKKKYI